MWPQLGLLLFRPVTLHAMLLQERLRDLGETLLVGGIGVLVRAGGGREAHRADELQD